MTIETQTELDIPVWTPVGLETGRLWAGRGMAAMPVDVFSVSWKGLLWWSLMGPTRPFEESVATMRTVYAFGARPGELFAFAAGAGIHLHIRSSNTVVAAGARLDFLSRAVGALPNPGRWLIAEAFQSIDLFSQRSLAPFLEDIHNLSGAVPLYSISRLKPLDDGGWEVLLRRPKDTAQARILLDAQLQLASAESLPAGLWQ